MSAATFSLIDRMLSSVRVKELFDEGQKAHAIAKKLGLPVTTVRRWTQAMARGESPKTDDDRHNGRKPVAVGLAAMTVAKPAKAAKAAKVPSEQDLAKAALKAARARVGPPANFPFADIYPTPPRNFFDMPWPHYNQGLRGHAMTLADVQDRRQKKVVVTSAQMATPVNAPFFQSIMQYCFATNSALVVIPFRYRNPTSQWTAEQEDHEWIAPELMRYVVDTRERLNANLVIAGDIPIQPTAVSPLSGLDTMGRESMIFGHARLESTTVPVPSQSTPKIVTTTGAITQPNYTHTKSGKKGEFHHSICAMIFEVDGDDFYPRHLSAASDGSFIDLNMQYNPFGMVPTRGATTLYLGDSHTYFKDEAVHQATFGMCNGSIAQVIQPKIVAVNDLSDLYSNGVRHHKNNSKIKYKKFVDNQDNLESEIDDGVNYLDEIASQDEDRIVYVVPSNHTDHLMDWLESFDPKTDPKNARLYHSLWIKYIDAVDANKKFDAFTCLVAEKSKYLKQIKLPYRDESFVVNGIEIGMHGDKGPNGSRGSRRGLDKIGVKSFIGHSHSPGIYGGCWQVGTSTVMDMGQNSGPSSWMNTHGVIYENGQRTLISIFDGKWGMKWDAAEYEWAYKKVQGLAVESPLVKMKPVGAVWGA